METGYKNIVGSRKTCSYNRYVIISGVLTTGFYCIPEKCLKKPGFFYCCKRPVCFGFTIITLRPCSVNIVTLLLYRYSKVKKVALKVVAWYRLNFIIQSQDTSLIARCYNLRQKHRTESITISAETLNKYYGVDGIDEFVERGSGGHRAYLPCVDNEQLLQHQKFSSRSNELNEKSLLRDVYLLKQQLTHSNDRVGTASSDKQRRRFKLKFGGQDYHLLHASISNFKR